MTNDHPLCPVCGEGIHKPYSHRDIGGDACPSCGVGVRSVRKSGKIKYELRDKPDSEGFVRSWINLVNPQGGAVYLPGSTVVVMRNTKKNIEAVESRFKVIYTNQFRARLLCGGCGGYLGESSIVQGEVEPKACKKSLGKGNGRCNVRTKFVFRTKAMSPVQI